MQRALARKAMFISFAVYKYLPYFLVKFISNALMAVAFPFLIRHKRVAKESLQIAFGQEKSEQEIRQITKKCFKNFGYAMVELLYSMANPRMVKNIVTLEGIENLEQALAKGNGVVAVTAHFGNFPLMMMALGQKGYKVSSIIRPVRDKKMEEFLVQKRQECKLNTVYAIPRTQCVRDSFKALKDNGILFVPLDQNFGNGKGVFVDFFGRKAATATGPIIFAERANAAILPMFIIRTDRDHNKVIIEKPLALVQGKDKKETIFLTTSKITNIIEEYIRKYPHEWGWFHERWKTRPSAHNT